MTDISSQSRQILQEAFGRHKPLLAVEVVLLDQDPGLTGNQKRVIVDIYQDGFFLCDEIPKLQAAQISVDNLLGKQFLIDYAATLLQRADEVLGATDGTQDFAKDVMALVSVQTPAERLAWLHKLFGKMLKTLSGEMTLAFAQAETFSHVAACGGLTSQQFEHELDSVLKLLRSKDVEEQIRAARFLKALGRAATSYLDYRVLGTTGFPEIEPISGCSMKRKVLDKRSKAAHVSFDYSPGGRNCFAVKVNAQAGAFRLGVTVPQGYAVRGIGKNKEFIKEERPDAEEDPIPQNFWTREFWNLDRADMLNLVVEIFPESGKQRLDKRVDASVVVGPILR